MSPRMMRHGIVAALSLLGSAAMAADAPTSPALEQGWDGMWDNTGGFVYDKAYAQPGKMPEQVREYPPYKPEWEARYVAVKKQHEAGIGNDPLGYCGPHGWPRLWGGAPGPIEIIVKPGQTIYMIWEYLNQVRRIYTDGRDTPWDELYPSHFGFSTGHWEGDTLVVETVSMMDIMPFDRTGAPHSDQVRTVEHIHMIDHDTLETTITVYDPVAFTKPWELTRTWKRMPEGSRMQDVYCDLQRNPIVDGQTQVILPGEEGYEESIKGIKGSNVIEGGDGE